jgi:hypothetical protein
MWMALFRLPQWSTQRLLPVAGSPVSNKIRASLAAPFNIPIALVKAMKLDVLTYWYLMLLFSYSHVLKIARAVTRAVVYLNQD